MAKYKKYIFSQIERECIWKAYGEKCFYCRDPLRSNSLNIDHILPESLLNTPDKLKSIIREFGLYEYEKDGLDEFSINSYYNWVPACRSCNLDKGNSIPEKTAGFHYLGRAKRKYLKIKEIEQRLKKADSLGKLTSNLGMCLEKRLISYEKIQDLSLLISISNKDQLIKDQLIFVTDTFCSLIKQGKHQEAILYIEKAIEIFPEDKTGFGHHSLGFCYLKLKKYQSAIDSCTRAIDTNPDLGLAYLVKGQAYFLPYYEDFLSDGENLDFLARISRYGDDIVAFQHYNLAIKNFDCAIKILSDHPDCFYWRSICKLFLTIRFRPQFLDNKSLLLMTSIEDLCKAAEIYFKDSKLSRCQETLKVYSELIGMYKDVFSEYENAKQLLNQWSLDYFASIDIQEK